MSYIELSIRRLEEVSKKLSQKISENFEPDVVVFIAKGSFIIGKIVSEYFNAPLIECYAVRKGNKLKHLLSPFIKIIPKSFKKYLREKELKSGFHQKNSDRNVYIERGINQLEKAKNILIVDDSVDTGFTAREVYNYINSKYKNKNIKFAVLNYFDDSKRIFKVDYNIFKNTILLGPWSKDSKEYNIFLKRYQNWKRS